MIRSVVQPAEHGASGVAALDGDGKPRRVAAVPTWRLPRENAGLRNHEGDQPDWTHKGDGPAMVWPDEPLDSPADVLIMPVRNVMGSRG